MIGEPLRKDFPLLSRPDAPVYLDNACMTLKPSAVIDAVTRYYTETPYCAGRAVYEGSLAVEEMMEGARRAVAAFLGGRPDATVWTKNATEAINLVAHTYPWRRGDVVLTTDREHNSNLVPWQMLGSRGVRHEVVASRPDGTLDLDAFATRIARGDVAFVAAVHVSNLDGYETPARELVEIAHAKDVPVLLDGAQAAAHRSVDLHRLGADYYAVSLHKMLGPTGVGALLGTPESLARLGPFITGGDTVARTTYEGAELLEGPARFEAGLQNYAGLAGVEPAIRYLEAIGMDVVHAHERDLMERAARAFEGTKGLSLVGAPLATRSGIVGFSLDEVDTAASDGRGLSRAPALDPHALAILLEDKHRMLVRSGDHCLHSWFNAHGVPGAVRASFSVYNTRAEAEAFALAVRDLLSQLQAP